MRYLYFIFFVFTLYACKKKVATAPTTPEAPGTARAIFINNIPDSLYISFSGLDIATGTLPHLFTAVLPPSDTFIIPHTELKDDYRYQYTWHNADYTYSDWFLFENNSKKEMHFNYDAHADDVYVNVTGKQRDDLLRCLDGDGISSTWVAVNAYDTNGVSVWQSLNAQQKNHRFIISRFHTVKHIYIDTSGKEDALQLSFSLYDSSARFMLRTVAFNKEGFVLTNDLSPVQSLSTGSRDTLYYSKYVYDSTGKLYYPQYYLKLGRTSVEK